MLLSLLRLNRRRHPFLRSLLSIFEFRSGSLRFERSIFIHFWYMPDLLKFGDPFPSSALYVVHNINSPATYLPIYRYYYPFHNIKGV